MAARASHEQHQVKKLRFRLAGKIPNLEQQSDGPLGMRPYRGVSECPAGAVKWIERFA